MSVDCSHNNVEFLIFVPVWCNAFLYRTEKGSWTFVFFITHSPSAKKSKEKKPWMFVKVKERFIIEAMIK